MPGNDTEVGNRMADPDGIPNLNVKILADGADLDGIARLARKPWIAGFTTNPTLMRRAGVTDYERFGREVLALVPDRPVSIEVIADDLETIEEQALIIGGWAPNAYVKIPVTTTRGEPCAPVVRRVADRGVNVNVTAVMTADQVATLTDALPDGVPAILSVFAGRIADTGRDPIPAMRRALEIMARKPMARLLWASPREVLNVYQADAIGCHMITCTSDLIAKLALHDKDLGRFSQETVEMFRRDALAAGYRLEPGAEVPQGRRIAAAE